MVRVDSSCCLLLIFTVQLLTTNARQEVLPNYPREHIEGVTFDLLREVFQSYPVERQNTDRSWWNRNVAGSCDDLSGYREIEHATSSFPQDSISRDVSKPCYSVLRNCRSDESMEKHARFCLSNDKYRRYDYMVINGGERYGHSWNSEKCPFEKSEIYFNYAHWYPCLCDCESTKREAGRYFSLQEVVANADQVVTAVRFKKVDHVFSIQIQQGKLGANKTIDGGVEWKDVKSVAKSDLLSSRVSEYYKQEGNNDNLLRFHKNDLVYAVTSEQNTVLLDDLMAGENEVLTGLRFRQVGQDLRLEIQVTPFYRKKGKLEKRASRWVYNDDNKEKRKEVKLPIPNVPGKNEAMNILSSGYQFVKFQVSDFKRDLGQTTVPFIDITEVVPEQPRPLTGAGIFHKGNRESGGFIALKVIL